MAGAAPYCTALLASFIAAWLVAGGHCTSQMHLPLPHLQVVPALSPLAGKLLDADAVGDEGQCARDTLALEQAASNRTLWAVRMLDASAHVPSGVLHGARYQLGHFDACTSAAAASPVGARYCLASLRHRPAKAATQTPALRTPWELVQELPPLLDAAELMSGAGMVDGSLPLGDVRAAVCVPRSCGPAVLQTALRRSLHRQHPTVDVEVLPEYCHAPGEERPSRAAALFWGLLGALTVASAVGPSFGWSAFDWRRHVRALGRPDPPLSGLDLAPVSGIRFISALYLVILHRAMQSGQAAITNYEYYTAAARSRPAFALLFRGTLAVDTFLFLAGFMLAVMPSRPVPFGAAFVSRLTRVMPVYVAVLLFFVTALPEVGSGPLWAETTQSMSEACRRWWWVNLLLIGNYFNGGTHDHACMRHSWSLFVDVHMFAVGTLLLRWLPVGLSGLAALAGLTALSPLPLFLATWLGDLPATITWSLRAMQSIEGVGQIHDVYTPTHMRTAPYFAGLLAGRGLLELKARGWHPGRGTTLACTALGVAVMLAVMCLSAPFAVLGAVFPATTRALYASLAPLFWSVAIAAVLVVTVLGEKTLVHALLSWQPLVTLSRLTFAVYAVSFPLQGLILAAQREATRVTPFSIVRDGLSDAVLSFLISFWLYVVVEAPARHLANKMLFGNRSAPPTEAKEVNKKQD